jgi:hypothetical protein
MISRVVALDLVGQPSKVRVNPSLGGSLVAGVRLFGTWSARAELGGNARPLRDVYSVRPTGELGRSPRATFSLAFGLQVDTNR